MGDAHLPSKMGTPSYCMPLSSPVVRKIQNPSARKQWVLMTQLVFQKLPQPSSRPHLLLIVNDQLQLAPQVPYLPFLFLVNEVKLKDKHPEKTRRGKEKHDTTEKNYNICNEIYNIRR